MAADADNRIPVPTVATVLVSTVSAEDQRLPGARFPADAHAQRSDRVVDVAVVGVSAGTRVEDAAAATQHPRVQAGEIAAVVVGERVKRRNRGSGVVVVSQNQ